MLSPYILGRKPKNQRGSQKMQTPRYNNERFTIHTTPHNPHWEISMIPGDGMLLSCRKLPKIRNRDLSEHIRMQAVALPVLWHSPTPATAGRSRPKPKAKLLDPSPICQIINTHHYF